MLSAATLPVLDKSFRLDDSQCWCLLYYALICDGVRRLFLPERISGRKDPGRPKRRRRTLLHWWRRLTGLPILCGFISVRPVRKPWTTKSGIPAIIDWQKSCQPICLSAAKVMNINYKCITKMTNINVSICIGNILSLFPVITHSYRNSLAYIRRINYSFLETFFHLYLRNTLMSWLVNGWLSIFFLLQYLLVDELLFYTARPLISTSCRKIKKFSIYHMWIVWPESNGYTTQIAMRL